jgi:hypothetical protein
LRDKISESAADESECDLNGSLSPIGDTTDDVANRIQVTTDLTNKPNVPPVIPVTDSKLKTAEDRLPDLSELPPTLLDYSTLLSTAPDSFNDSDSHSEKREPIAGGEEYLKLLTESASLSDPFEESKNDQSYHQPGSVHHDVGLMFRRAPIKRS